MSLYRLATESEKAAHPSAAYWRTDTKTFHDANGFPLAPAKAEAVETPKEETPKVQALAALARPLVGLIRP